MRRARRAAIACAIGFAFAACGPPKPPPPVIETQEAKVGYKTSPPPSEPKAGESSDKTSDSDSKSGGEGGFVAGEEPSVTLLEPGSEPRHPLRHKFSLGSAQKLSMRARTVVKGASLPIPAINLTAPMQSSITAVDSKTGEAKFKFSAGPFKTGSGGGGGGDLGGLLGGLGGGGGGGGEAQKVAGTGVITSRGYIKEYHVEEGAKDEDAPVESGDPFPEEAVGVGARWQVKSLINDKQGQVRQTTTYTLIKFDKKNVFTKISRVQEPVGGGSDAAGAGKSSGELVFRLGEIYPTGQLEMTRNMKIDVPGLDATTLKLVSEVTIKR